ncbi:hypothetical protein B0H11DRAFT_2189944 [Mycena galericulata]|nr:hypothetical protein B0H11DRAFT_2189944 [Mycena galericulata]
MHVHAGVDEARARICTIERAPRGFRRDPANTEVPECEAPRCPYLDVTSGRERTCGVDAERYAICGKRGPAPDPGPIQPQLSDGRRRSTHEQVLNRHLVAFESVGLLDARRRKPQKFDRMQGGLPSRSGGGSKHYKSLRTFELQESHWTVLHPFELSVNPTILSNESARRRVGEFRGGGFGRKRDIGLLYGLLSWLEFEFPPFIDVVWIRFDFVNGTTLSASTHHHRSPLDGSSRRIPGLATTK